MMNPFSNTDKQRGPGSGGVTGKGFMPGQSGHAGGRPKGLVGRIRELTEDGERLVDYMWEVFNDPLASRRDRMEAASWLADRGFGKPLQQVVTAQAKSVYFFPSDPRKQVLPDALPGAEEPDAGRKPSEADPDGYVPLRRPGDEGKWCG